MGWNEAKNDIIQRNPVPALSGTALFFGLGKAIVKILSNELQKEFPGAKGYSAANLWRMCNFYLSYRNSEKLAPLVREISWSNNVVIMEKSKKREF